MSDSVIRLAVVGAAGRMGERVCALADDDDAFELVAAIDRAELRNRPVLQAKTIIDAIIDFSSPEGAGASLALARTHGAALLVCTTGLSRAVLETVDAAAAEIPVMLAPNTSPGVAVMRRLVADAATLLGPAYAVEIVEAHHARKVDAPSGTALSLVEALAGAGRAVPPGHVHAIRGGDIVGEHEVWFAGPGETIRIAHSAVSRDLFARGALRAARWLVHQRPGRYTIEDSLASPGSQG